nr:hypothetical protein [Zea mays]
MRLALSQIPARMLGTVIPNAWHYSNHLLSFYLRFIWWGGIYISCFLLSRLYGIPYLLLWPRVNQSIQSKQPKHSKVSVFSSYFCLIRNPNPPQRSPIPIKKKGATKWVVIAREPSTGYYGKQSTWVVPSKAESPLSNAPITISFAIAFL